MGVKNLWRLLLPVGHRLSIETLSHQTLAIDASIWLTQVSKACRDPETGRLLPNRPHVRIFLLRLMRMLYHQIRPVMVFDGAMPEVKRREIRRRKDARERLWRDEYDGEKGGALKRAAKKILVKQLKEWREKEARLKKGDAEEEEEDGNDGEGKGSGRASGSANGGAFAAGFTLADDAAKEEPPRKQSDANGMSPQQSKGEAVKSDDVISINSKDSEKGTTQQAATRPVAMAEEGQEYESENDWEMSRAVQSSISDSLRQQQSSDFDPQYDDNPFEHAHYRQATNATIAALPSEARSKWIDTQRSQRRIQSRKECIQAAANPEDYSNAQLRNFLKGSKLNKRVDEIGKLVEKRVGEGGLEEGGGDAGFVAVGGATHRRPLQRVRRPGDGHASDSDEDNAMLENDAAQRGASMKVLFGEDDSDDDGGGGGFLVPSSSADHAAAASLAIEGKSGKKNEVILLDADGDAKGDGGGKLPSNDQPPMKGVPSKSSKLLDLATAGEEWENWGADDKEDGSGEVAHIAANAVGVKRTTSPIVLDAAESESDDDGQGLLFALSGATGPRASAKVAATESPSAPIAANDGEAANDEGDDYDDDVDWEDGDSEGEAEDQMDTADKSHDHAERADQSNNEHAPSHNRPVQEQQEMDSVEEVVELQSSDESVGSIQRDDGASTNEDTAVSSEEDRRLPTKAILGDNEFDSFHPNNDTAVALQHAQETASRLTSWAGRAFQRAISAHVGEKPHPGSPSGNDVAENEDVDVADHSAMDVDARGNEAAASAEAHESFSARTKQPNVENHESPPSPAKPDLFDTSLDGLNEAYDGILARERAKEGDMITITDEMKDDILRLLQLSGIPWVESPSEAEAQCAALEELGLVDGVVTEDSDAFVFGAKKVYKNFFDEKKWVEAYYARDMKRDLALGKHQLVALAMLLGGDYTDGVKGVGIVNGMEILQAFTFGDSENGVKEGLQRFRDWLEGIDDVHDLGSDEASKEFLFHKKHKSARTRWSCPSDFPSQAVLSAYLRPTVDKSEATFSWAKPDLRALQQFCAEKLGWEQEETDKVVTPVLKVLESGSKQTRLESFFMRYEDGITFAQVRSKRLRDVLSDIQGKSEDQGLLSFANDAEVEPSDIQDDGAEPEKKRQKR